MKSQKPLQTFKKSLIKNEGKPSKKKKLKSKETDPLDKAFQRVKEINEGFERTAFGLYEN